MSAAPPLPVTLVRLKVRLVRNRARSTRGGGAQLLVAMSFAALAVFIGAPGAFAIAHGHDRLAARNAAVLGASAVSLGWALLPLLTVGTDESLDPSRLALFPLRRRPLMQGLVLSSLVGPAPVAVILVVLAGAMGFAGGTGTVVVLAAAVLLVLFSITAARTLSTALAAGLSSRRGRDLTIVIGSLFFLALQGVRFVHLSAIDTGVVARIIGVLRWLPPGMLGHALVDASAGRLLVAVAELVPAALLTVVLMRLWARGLDRASTVVLDGATARRHRTKPTALPLLFRRLPFVRPTPWGAVAAKELRYANRDPRRKVLVINATLIGAGAPLFLALSSSNRGPGSVLLATLAGYIVVLGSLNQFGFDRGALWMDMAAGNHVRDELVGKNLATCIQIAPVVMVVGVALAALTGGWLYLPAAVVISVAGLGAGLATANVVSVRFPVRLPESKSPFGGSGGGQGCATSGIVLVCTVAQNLIIAPVAVAALVATRVAPAWLIILAPACALYGGLLWWAGLTIAIRYGEAHQPELLEAVDPARSDTARAR